MRSVAELPLENDPLDQFADDAMRQFDFPALPTSSGAQAAA